MCTGVCWLSSSFTSSFNWHLCFKSYNRLFNFLDVVSQFINLGRFNFITFAIFDALRGVKIVITLFAPRSLWVLRITCSCSVHISHCNSRTEQLAYSQDYLAILSPLVFHQAGILECAGTYYCYWFKRHFGSGAEEDCRWSCSPGTFLGRRYSLMIRAPLALYDLPWNQESQMRAACWTCRHALSGH